MSGNSNRTHCRFRCGFRNSLNYSSRSLNFLNTSIGMFAITISTVWLSKQIPIAYKRQDEIFAKINELKIPVTVIPPNINGMFIRGYHIKLRYVVTFIVIIVTWAVAASVSSTKHREEAFAYYSMYRAVKEQHQFLLEKAGIELKRNTE